MSRFEFKTSSESEDLCEKIADVMRAQFGISRDEAVQRINQSWSGFDISDPDDVVFHEDEVFWASTIYFGKDSRWWIPDDQRRAQGLPELAPIPLKK